MRERERESERERERERERDIKRIRKRYKNTGVRNIERDIIRRHSILNYVKHIYFIFWLDFFSSCMIYNVHWQRAM